MAGEISQELDRLREMTVAELRDRHREVCGRPGRSRHKGQLVRRIAWWLQALEASGLSERAQRRVQDLIDSLNLQSESPQPPRKPKSSPAQRRDPRLPPPGTLLVREYGGQTVEVQVCERGFAYEDRIYSSLTAVVKQITGQHWNGYHFFSLSKGNKQT